MIQVFVSLSLIVLACGHNWVNSPTRSGHGSAPSTVKPTKPSRDGLAHVRVAAGELFPVEWVAGHREWIWFVFMKSGPQENQQMLTHTDANLQDYVDNAPADQRRPPKGVKNHQNFHYKFKDETRDFDPKATKNNPNPPRDKNWYKRLIRPGDPDYIPRNPLFTGHFKGLADSGNWKNINKRTLEWDKFFMFEYQDKYYDINRYCMYKSNKRNQQHIIGVAKYDLVRNMPNRPDVALLSFPANTPPGRYLIHYIWRGYYDAIDVDIVAGPPRGSPYGFSDIRPVLPVPAGQTPPPAPVPTPPPKPIEPRYKRMDHCQFINNQLKGQCRGIRANQMDAVPQACIDECNSMSRDECDGVAVVQLSNPSSVWKGFRDIVNIPFGANCAKNALSAFTHVCYPLKAREIDPSTVNVGPTTITRDTEDPIWYSTCYIRTALPNRGPDFDYGPIIAVDDVALPAFEFNSKCVSCADMKRNAARNVTPRWQLTSDCVNCYHGQQPTPLSPTPPPPSPPSPTPPPASGGGTALLRIHVPFEGTIATGATLSLQGGATLGGPAKLGQRALQMTSGGARASLGNVGVPGAHVTIALWVRSSNFNTGDQRALTKTSQTAVLEHVWLLGTNRIASAQRPRGVLKLSTGVVELRDRESTVAPNEWVHIAMSYDGERVRLLTNGKTVNSRKIDGASAMSSGSEAVVLGHQVTGAIDDVRVYTRGYADADLAKIMLGNNP